VVDAVNFTVITGSRCIRCGEQCGWNRYELITDGDRPVGDAVRPCGSQYLHRTGRRVAQRGVMSIGRHNSAAAVPGGVVSTLVSAGSRCATCAVIELSI